jgi:hypothetical protein
MAIFETVIKITVTGRKIQAGRSLQVVLTTGGYTEMTSRMQSDSFFSYQCCRNNFYFILSLLTVQTHKIVLF